MTIQGISKRRAYSMLIVVMVLWASGIIVARAVHDQVAPIGFSFWRWFAAIVLLTPFALTKLREHGSFLRTQIARVALLGLFIAGGSTIITIAVQFTTATNIALVSDPADSNRGCRMVGFARTAARSANFRHLSRDVWHCRHDCTIRFHGFANLIDKLW
jgi:hypothetical protein